MGYTFEAAAKYAGLSVAAIEAEVKRGAVKVFKLDGQHVINGEGLAYLQGVAKVRNGAGEVPAAHQSAASPDPDDPSTWTDEQIQAKAAKITAELRGSNPDPAFSSHGGIRIPEGR
jgi:hypothetical protein